MSRYSLIEMLLVLGIVNISSVASADPASTRPEASIKVLGKCSKYFRGPEQKKDFSLSSRLEITCRVKVRLRAARRRSSHPTKFDLIAQSGPSGHFLGPDYCPIGEVCISFPKLTVSGVTDTNGVSRVHVTLSRHLRYSFKVKIKSAALAAADCAELVNAMNQELDNIRSCEKDEDCGQILNGTSCGCTMNKVANLISDTSYFYMLNQQVIEQCPESINTTICICPPTSGFRCAMDRCEWKYNEEFPVF